MVSYLLRRLLGALGIFLLVTYAIWLLTSPTGFIALHHLTLSALVPTRYLLWLNLVLHGDLGYSVKEHGPVLNAIQSHLLVTILLVVPAFLLQQALAIGLGTQAGAHPRSWFDRLAVGTATLFVAIPAFWLALLGVALAIFTHWLPAFDIANLRISGYAFGSAGYWSYFAAHRGAELLDITQHLILPVAVLGVLGAAGDGMFVRQTIAEVMQADYIRAARARGLPRRVVLWKHALRNGLLPILTNITSQLPQLVFIAAVVEFVFALPGAGWLFVHAFYIQGAGGGLNSVVDHPLLTGTLLFFAAVTLLSGLFTDVLYAIADPRIRVAGSSRAMVTNPLRSTRSLVQLGSVSVRLGPTLIAGLVALALVLAGATVNELRQLYAPVSADWSGTLIINEPMQPVTLPVFLHLLISADGKVTGQIQGCQYYGSLHATVINLTGSSDNLNTISLNGANPLSTIYDLEGLSLSGSYTGANGALNLAGFVSDGSSATLQTNLGGTIAQYQQDCIKLKG